MLPILLATSLLLGAVFVYLLWTRDWEHWEKKGVVGPKPSFPYGNVRPVFDAKETFGDFLERTINKWPEEPLIGFYSFFKPMLIVNDPDLVKVVLVRDFHNFVDNAIDLSCVDSLLKKSLFWIKGYQPWKETRALFTPSLTSSKQKTMFPIMVESTQRHFYGRPQNEAEVFKAIKLMLHDSILRIAFGVEVDLINEMKNVDSPYKEYLEGDLFVDRKGSHLLSCASHLAHWYLKFSRRRVVSQERHDFYVRFINSCVDARKKSQETRNDILQAIIDIEKKAMAEGKPGFTPEDWASNMLTVMLDSTETIGLVFKLVLFALARNPKEQEKLRTEVLKNGSKLEDYDYDKVATLKRMDMFINESLRVYPPLMGLGKICVKTTKLGDVVVEKGTFLFIPTSSFQMNPKYFPNPTTFDPDRFANTGNIKSCYFLPFGEGPRACLGQRYGLMAMKILLVKFLVTFNVSLEGDLDEPVVHSKKSPFINVFQEEPKWKFTQFE